MKFYQFWIYVNEIQPHIYNLLTLGLEKNVLQANLTSNESTIDGYPDTTFHDYPDTTYYDYPYTTVHDYNDTTDYDYPYTTVQDYNDTTDYDYLTTTEWSNNDDVENDTSNEIASEGKLILVTIW